MSMWRIWSFSIGIVLGAWLWVVKPPWSPWLPYGEVIVALLLAIPLFWWVVLALVYLLTP